MNMWHPPVSNALMPAAFFLGNNQVRRAVPSVLVARAFTDAYLKTYFAHEIDLTPAAAAVPFQTHEGL